MRVYFVQAGDERGPIKIGVSSDVDARVSSIQTGNHLPCRVLASFEHSNAVLVEKRLHRIFEDLRLEGEWFKFDATIMDLIDAWKFVDADHGNGSHPTTILDRVRESNVRQVIANWWVVTWSKRLEEARSQPLLEYLSLAHQRLFFGRDGLDSSDFVIVGIVETEQESDRLRDATESWLWAMGVVDKLEIHNERDWSKP